MRSNAADLRVKLASFEGPLDLLLYLTRQNEIDIRDIKIQEITDQYLRHLEMMREFNLDIAGDFILMASTLILLKSRRLLPQDEENPDANIEGEIETEEQLMHRLLEHQRYQEVARTFKELPRMGWDNFTRPLPEGKARKEQILKEMNISELSLALQQVLMRVRRPVRRVQRETVSVAQAITWIVDKLSMQEAVELSNLFPETTERSEIVATFLAILELGRLKKIRVLQHVIYGSIYVVAREDLELNSLETLFEAGDSYAYNPPEVGA